MAQLPSGTVTFLFTDLESSSRLWEEHPEAMRVALARHDAILAAAVGECGGHVLKTTGDGVLAVFRTALDGTRAALGAQLALGREPWGATGPLLVRMALHTGEAEERGGDYFGPAVNRAARLMAIAHGGQVVVSRATEAVVRDGLPEPMDLLDLGEHRLSDLSRPEQAFQVVHPDLCREFPPLRSLDRVPGGNLPVQVTSFVGREQESQRVAATLGQARVVTLTGVGGVGKTRLALHVAGTASVSARYRDGCWLCELAAVRDPEAVPDAVVTAMGVEPRPGITVTEALLEFMRAKELLLVLDNCEHLLQPVSQLVSRIEQTCPGVEVLATSREGLGVAGEWILAVASLGVADPDADLEAVRGCDAVQLFVDRARAVKTGFALDATNADAVAQVCRRLDGIALAIELAAARVATLSPGELAGRLDQRFRVLGGGQRATVERHQTLRAAIDWSYELMGDAEQVLFDRLSVFAGGFTLDAAEAIGSGQDVEVHDVFDLLASLVARSLVVAHTGGTETRYTLYETIRQYAQEQLDRRGDTDRVRHQHAEFYARFAESIAQAHAASPDDIEWDDELDQEVDNLRAAFTWAVDSQDADTALRLLANFNIPSMSAVVLAFRTAADAAIAIPGAAEHPNLPGALAAVAWYAYQRDDQQLAIRRCDEALAAEQRLGTEPDPRIWTLRAFIAMARGAIDEHIEYTARAAAVHRARGDTAGLASALGQSALGHTLRGDTAAAASAAEEAVALARSIDARGATAAVLSLAAFGLAESDPERALALVNEAIDLNASLGSSPGPVWALASHIAARLGNRHDALRFSARAIEQAHRIGARPAVAPMLRRTGDLLVPDDPETAAILHGAGDTAFPMAEVEEDHRRAVAALDATLGVTRRSELNNRGKAMNQDHAVALALDAISQVVGPDDQIGPTKPHS